ncbi:MAG: hypothetical protein Q9209_006099 [Squamulea sp. 1 TL-2023]
MSPAELPAADPTFQSTALGVIDQELQTQHTVPTMAHNIAQRLSQEVKGAGDAHVVLRLAFPHDLRFRLKHSDYGMHAYSPSASWKTTQGVLKDISHVSETSWILRVAIQEEREDRKPFTERLRDAINRPQGDIRKLFVQFACLPAITGANPKPSELDVDPKLIRIMEQELLARISVPAVGHNIARRIMTEIPRAQHANVEMRTSFPKVLTKRMLSSAFKVFSVGSLNSPMQSKVPYDTTVTRWSLSVATRGQTIQHEYEFSMSWPSTIVTQNPRLAEEYDDPARNDNPFPTFRLHRKIADFIESKSHQSFDVLAFEAAMLFFGSSESVLGPSPSRSVYITVNDEWGLPEGSPRPNTTYKFNGQWYETFQQAQRSYQIRRRHSRVFVALGSNIGDRVSMIEQACVEMTRRGLKVRHTSSLYETEAMYKTDQQSFVNGVCEITTTLTPIKLLDQLQYIERSLGRIKTVENGPRTIDLDILLYDNQTVNEERLQIPHPRMTEREFVLRPLCDLIPHSFLPQPSILVDFAGQLSILSTTSSPISPLTPLTRFAPTSPPSQLSQTLTSSLPTRKTHLMAILNLTPDSFSQDGKYTADFDPSSLLPQLNSLLHHQIPILDIGGQSTRPHASPLSASEELARILPTIRYIRSNPDFNSILLCIDTYHSTVARACIEAGADIINDISGGLMDDKMFSTVAELGCTYILMHMRGTPETMTSRTQYPEGVINGIASELNERVQKAMEAGIRRWRIILDPGIGFAKTAEQNLEVLRKLPELRDAEGLKGLPWCVGVSRKGFIGKVSGLPSHREEMKESGPRYFTDTDAGEREKGKESGPSYITDTGADEREKGKQMVEGEARGDAGPGVQKGEEMRERVWGTAAAVTACVQGGADVVRVHDWEEMGRVVRMGDAVWRV